MFKNKVISLGLIHVTPCQVHQLPSSVSGMASLKVIATSHQMNAIVSLSTPSVHVCLDLNIAEH